MDRWSERERENENVTNSFFDQVVQTINYFKTGYFPHFILKNVANFYDTSYKGNAIKREFYIIIIIIRRS
jgi:hypothetical protein